MQKPNVKIDEKELTGASSAVAAKWGEAVALGFLAIPDALLINQSKLQIDATETMVLFNVLSYWWYKERKPFPRSSTIAKRMGVSPRTVQRALNRLQGNGILSKTRNELGVIAFDPTPLVDRLEVLAKEDPRFLLKGGATAT